MSSFKKIPMAKYLKWSVLVVVFLLFVYIFNSNKQLSRDIQEKKIEEMAEWLMKQSEASSFDAKGLEIKEINGAVIPLASIVESDKRLGVYVNRLFCSDCWKITVRDVAHVTKSLGLDEPFILAEGFNLRDIKIMAREDSLLLPIFLLQPHENKKLQQLALQYEPFVFFLNCDSTISSAFFLSDVMAPAIQKFIFMCNSKESGDSLVIKNPIIDLGHVPFRRKFNLSYIISNTRDETYVIKRVETSCGCLEADTTEIEILPSSETVFPVRYYSDSKGVFSKKVRLSTDEREKPYVLTVKGVCE